MCSLDKLIHQPGQLLVEVIVHDQQIDQETRNGSKIEVLFVLLPLAVNAHGWARAYLLSIFELVTGKALCRQILLGQGCWLQGWSRGNWIRVSEDCCACLKPQHEAEEKDKNLLSSLTSVPHKLQFSQWSARRGYHSCLVFVPHHSDMTSRERLYIYIYIPPPLTFLAIRHFLR